MIRFGTSGWRAVISDEFTFDNVRKVTLAIAEYLKRHRLAEKGVVVGYDTRFLSKEFALASAGILSGKRIKVYLADRDVPTPAVSFHIIKNRCAGGINITASHNPACYNGIKFSSSFGGPASNEITDEIEELVNEINLKEVKNLIPCQEFIKTFNPAPQYKKRLKELIDLKVIKKAGLKTGLDCMYGTCRGYLDEILNETGTKIVILNSCLNPLFGGKRPEPDEKTLAELRQIVKKDKLDLGLACDGDADRFGIIDSSGEYIAADWVMSMIFYYLIKTRARLKKVARTIATTYLIDKIARKFGIEVIETSVGFKYIGEVLRRGDCILGGEESGGLSIAGHLPEKDGILACLLMTEMVSFYQKTPKAILKNIFKEVGREYFKDRIDIGLKPRDKEHLLKKLCLSAQSKFIGRKAAKVQTQDGYKFIFEDESWVLFRPSGTEPVIRCYLEAHSEEDLERLKKETHNFLNS